MKSWREKIHEWPPIVPDFKIEPVKTALMILDMQRSMVGEEVGIIPMLKNNFPKLYSYVLPHCKNTVIPNIVKLLYFFRRKGLRVVHVTVGPELPDGSDFTPIRRTSDKDIGQAKEEEKALHPKGTTYHAIIDELKPQPTKELVVNKITRSVFNSTRIDFTLRNMGIDSLVITGCVTNGCVESTARDAADKAFKTILADDACLGFDQLSHDATMKSIATLFGKVRNTDEIIRYLSKEKQAKGI